jgi:general secretion pathway protein A
MAGKNVVLLIDEAQMLKGPVLELIRTLNNYETDDAKLIQIVLFAQLELRDSLRDASKRAIESRVFVYSMLAPLSPAETARMISFRLERARSAMRFTQDAIERVYTLTNGVPRETMRLCEVAYMFADANGLTGLEPDIVDLAHTHVKRP